MNMKKMNKSQMTVGGDLGLEAGLFEVSGNLDYSLASMLPGAKARLGVQYVTGNNPNSAAAHALFPALAGDAGSVFPPDTDLVLVWGEGFSFAQLPPKAKIIYLNAWLQPENGHADVFMPISVQTERSGHYTNFNGVISAFEACFAKKPTVADAEVLFAALAPAQGGAS